jgi:hypothetical protein
VPDDAFASAVLIGGPAAAGRTTVARLLARKHGLRWYSTDAHGWRHRARAVEEGLHDPDDPSPGDFDRKPMIHADLSGLAAENPAAGSVVEGALITPGMGPGDRSVWLMPSAAEQRRRLVDRSGTADIHHGLAYGHRLITEQLSGTSATVIAVDGQTISETLIAVEVVLARALERLPSAETARDRRRVIRFGNRSLAEQLRIKLDSGVKGLSILPTFDCECGSPDCTATVRLDPEQAIALIGEPPGAVRSSTHAAIGC